MSSFHVDVDLLDPTILREDINDLRVAYQQAGQETYWHVRTKTENLQSQIDTLNIAVESLQGKIDKLNGWKAKSKTEQSSLNQRIIDIYAEFTSKISQVNTHANTLDHVVLKHHPESYADLGYTLHEETTSTPTVEEVSDSSPISVALPAVEEAPSLGLEVVIPQ